MAGVCGPPYKGAQKLTGAKFPKSTGSCPLTHDTDLTKLIKPPPRAPFAVYELPNKIAPLQQHIATTVGVIEKGFYIRQHPMDGCTSMALV